MKKNKNKNLQEVAYLRKIAVEEYKINQKLEAELTDLVKNGESLSNYELWVNKKCSICLHTHYIIKIIEKDFEKEHNLLLPYKENELVYVIVKKEE